MLVPTAYPQRLGGHRDPGNDRPNGSRGCASSPSAGAFVSAALDQTPLPQYRQNLVGSGLRRQRHRVDPDLRRLGRFVRRVDAGEVLDLAAARLLVEALRIALLGDRERRVDEDLDELALASRPRAMRRSARNGEMNAVRTIRPASTMSFATSAMRRMFSTRSAAVKPRSLFSPWRTLSPSRM